MKKLYSVKVRILHKECWTEKIKQYKIRTIKISPYGSKKVKVIIASPGHQIIKDLKESENVNEVIKHRKLNGGYLIEFSEDKDNTIAGTLLEFEDKILNYSNVVNKGIEFWDFVTTSKGVINSLKERFGIEDIEVKGISLDQFLGNTLTEKEVLILKTALNMGYFNYPRNVKAKDIAEILGISKQDFLYHLRNSINKIITLIDLDK